MFKYTYVIDFDKINNKYSIGPFSNYMGHGLPFIHCGTLEEITYSLFSFFISQENLASNYVGGSYNKGVVSLPFYIYISQFDDEIRIMPHYSCELSTSELSKDLDVVSFMRQLECSLQNLYKKLLPFT